MEQPVYFQLLTAFISFAGGLFWGIYYDLLKALRLRAKSVIITALCDLSVCLAAFCILVFLSMSPGRGEARLYIFISAIVGAAVYFSTFSPAFLAYFGICLDLAARVFRILRRPLAILPEKLVKTKNIFKNLFQKMCLWFTIGIDRKKFQNHTSSSRSTRNGREHTHEAGTCKSNHKNCHSRAHSIRGGKSC
ncbi:MAG: spore cortex biosynthesis protein YabQ, partial [Oscillospiraceae bacterium]